MTIHRPSTTDKITKAILELIEAETMQGIGVIVRHKGVEYGCIDVVFGKLATVEGTLLDAKQCTVRKGLWASIKADYLASVGA